MKDFALGLGLKQRQKATRKWPIQVKFQSAFKKSFVCRRNLYWTINPYGDLGILRKYATDAVLGKWETISKNKSVTFHRQPS